MCGGSGHLAKDCWWNNVVGDFCRCNPFPKVRWFNGDRKTQELFSVP